MPEREALLLQKHINDFADLRRGYFSQITFFGKISTSTKPYYILECLPAKPRKQMYRFQGQQMKSTITDDFKHHRLTKQYFEEKEKI